MNNAREFGKQEERNSKGKGWEDQIHGMLTVLGERYPWSRCSPCTLKRPISPSYGVNLHFIRTIDDECSSL